MPRLSVVRPLTMKELLADPIYKSYILKTPRIPGARPEGSTPWRVWGERNDDKWAGKLFGDYREAFELVKKMLKDPLYVDVAIICRPVYFGPPPGFVIPPLMDWCGRCRRPSVFRVRRTHHEMKKWPVISDEPVRRCYYCAAREESQRWSR